MTDSLKLAEMQRTSIEFERQRHLANWFIKSSPHMATPSTPLSTNGVVSSGSGAGGSSTNNTSATQSGNAGTKNGSSSTPAGGGHVTVGGKINTTNPLFFVMTSNGNAGAAMGNPNGIPKNGGGKHCSGPETAAKHSSRAHPVLSAAKGTPLTAATHHVEGRKPKLRRFNSHDTGANMFSVADFENARLARRNEVEMKQRLQRRMKLSAQGVNGYAGGMAGCGVGGGGGVLGLYGNGSLSGDCSTGDSKGSKRSNDSQTEPLPAEIFLDRFTLPRVVRISYKTKFSHETLQSSSSNGSSTVTTNSSTQSSSGTGGMDASGIGTGTGTGNGTSSAPGIGTGTGTSSSTASSSGNINNSNTNMNNSNNNSNNNNNNNISSNNNNINTGNLPQRNGSSLKHGGNSGSTAPTNCLDHSNQTQGAELFLLYRLVRQRHIYHGFNAKTGVANRKKGVMIPQEFPGYFSLINEKGLPTATLYTSLIQLVRERVYKFVSVENMPAFTESQPNPVTATQTSEGCLPGGYLAAGGPPPPPTPTNRPQYVKTTARGGQVFRLLAVFEDGKQEHSNSSMTYKQSGGHGREKEKGRYAQLLNEQRQVLYVSLGTKGKFYEIEPGIPQILQKLSGIGSGADHQRKANPDCVHRITALIPPQKELPHTLRFISGPAGSSNSIPEQLNISRISTETIIVACPIDDVEAQSPIHLRKLHINAEMQLVKCSLGFETEQRMFANPNVQNILKFCQFNCDQFLRMVEVEVLNRTERNGSKSRGGDALRILKPLHLPRLLRREKTAIAHEKEDSIIFLSKHDLANLEAKEQQKRHSDGGGSSNRISDKMKVFQTTKKKWFRRQDKHAIGSLTSLDLDVQAKRMSMERYNDMSKLLQERFGDKHTHTNGASNAADESISERSASEIGCSDTETTTLHSTTIEEKLQKFGKTKPLLQKSQSLQDVELIGCGKPDLLRSHHADTISEAGTDVEDMENRPPSSNAEGQLPHTSSFITEKLYTEFHVKTRQYSKSSSSLHQLLHFSPPQKMQLHEHKQQRSTLAQLKQQQLARAGNSQEAVGARKLEFNIGEPVTGRRAAGGLSLLAANGGSFSMSGHSQNTSALISPLTPNSLLEDDLPYSSVRDSLVLSSDDSGTEQSTPGQICQALHLIDYAKENIYAEICHDAVAMGGLPRNTHSLHVDDEDDEYGDYASLTPPYMSIGGGGTVARGAAQSISRVHINFSSSPVSYHTVYLGEEPLGEQYATTKKPAVRSGRIGLHATMAAASVGALGPSDLANVTTVECVPPTTGLHNGSANEAGATNSNYHHHHHHHHPHHHHHRHSNDDNRPSVVVADNEPADSVGVGHVVDNIYNTLK